MTAGIAYPADYSATYSGPQYTANQGRTALAGGMGGASSSRPLGGFSGVRPGTPTNTVTATSTTWTAGAFAGYIDTAASSTNGGYFFSFPSGGTGSVTAAAASARIDIIYVQLSDVNTGDGTTVAPKVDVLYLAGTAGSGVPPTTPARSFVIANINVPATGGGSPTVTWNAPYTAAAGGVRVFTTEAALKASTGTDGQLAYAQDTSRMWISIATVWTSYGPTSESTTATAGPTAGYSMDSYNYVNRVGYRVVVNIAVTKGASTLTSGDTIATLPSGFRPPIALAAVGLSTTGGGAGYVGLIVNTDGTIVINSLGNASARNARLNFTFDQG